MVLLIYGGHSHPLSTSLPTSVPLSTPPTGCFYLKTQAHTQVNILPLPGFSHPPPHLVHTPDLTSSDPHGRSQAHLCSASLRQWWDPPSSSQIPCGCFLLRKESQTHTHAHTQGQQDNPRTRRPPSPQSRLHRPGCFSWAHGTPRCEVG